MNRLTFIRAESLERLQSNIIANTHRYSEAAPWLTSFFSGSSWLQESNIIQFEPFQLVMPVSKTEHRDLDNTRIVYSALRHLTPQQAADPRMWAYMTHVTHWEYMRERWPVAQYLGKKDFKDNMQDHYFLKPPKSRALVHNGLARLWWYGYCSYDQTRDDPFELTTVLLKNLDVAQTLLERAFSHNTAVTRTMLAIMLEREKQGKAFYVRERVRDLAKYMVQVGGVTIIDALDEPDLRDLVTGKIEQLTAA